MAKKRRKGNKRTNKVRSRTRFAWREEPDSSEGYQDKIKASFEKIQSMIADTKNGRGWKIGLRGRKRRSIY